MKSFIAGVFVGGALAVVPVVFLVLPDVRENHREIGRNDGAIEAKWEIASRLAGALGTDVDPSEPHEVLYDVKAARVVIVERGGVKTLRLIR